MWAQFWARMVGPTSGPNLDPDLGARALAKPFLKVWAQTRSPKKTRADHTVKTPPPELKTEPYGASYDQKPCGKSRRPPSLAWKAWAPSRDLDAPRGPSPTRFLVVTSTVWLRFQFWRRGFDRVIGARLFQGSKTSKHCQIWDPNLGTNKEPCMFEKGPCMFEKGPCTGVCWIRDPVCWIRGPK